MRYFFYLFLAVMLSGCLEEGEGSVTCGLGFDEDLLDNPPASDSVYFRITESTNAVLLNSWNGIVNEEASDSLGSTTYENLLPRNRTPNNIQTTLNGLGIEIGNPTDSTSVMLSFDFIETSTLERQCRFNKTLREEHFFSIWEKNKEGSRIDVAVRENGERTFYTTDFEKEDEDDFKVFLSGVEFLDEARAFGLLKGTFRAKVINVDLEEPSPVTISGEFQVIAQVSYGTTVL